MNLRAAKGADAGAMADILNQLIRIGGTTSYLHQVSATALDRMVLHRQRRLTAHVADDGVRLVGWQAISRHPDLPEGCGDIGTYIRPGLQRRGTGTALFSQSLETARALGLVALHALLREDNPGAAAFYARLGFRPVHEITSVFPDLPLPNRDAPALVLPDGRSIARTSLIRPL